MQQAVLFFIEQKHSQSKDSVEQNKIFTDLDVNNDGVLTREELVAGYKKFFGKGAGYFLAEQQADEILKIADFNGSGDIDYTEWLIATKNRN